MSKQQILIVDDEEINRAILTGIFENEGYEILEAENGRDAIHLMDSNFNIVLVLLDVIMPVLDGFGVLEYMKQNELLDSVPVILITGEVSSESEDRDRKSVV